MCDSDFEPDYEDTPLAVDEINDEDLLNSFMEFNDDDHGDKDESASIPIPKTKGKTGHGAVAKTKAKVKSKSMSKSTPQKMSLSATGAGAEAGAGAGAGAGADPTNVLMDEVVDDGTEKRKSGKRKLKDDGIANGQGSSKGRKVEKSREVSAKQAPAKRKALLEDEEQTEVNGDEPPTKKHKKGPVDDVATQLEDFYTSKEAKELVDQVAKSTVALEELKGAQEGEMKVNGDRGLCDNGDDGDDDEDEDEDYEHEDAETESDSSSGQGSSDEEGDDVPLAVPPKKKARLVKPTKSLDKGRAPKGTSSQGSDRSSKGKPVAKPNRKKRVVVVSDEEDDEDKDAVAAKNGSSGPSHDNMVIPKGPIEGNGFFKPGHPFMHSRPLPDEEVLQYDVLSRTATMYRREQMKKSKSLQSRAATYDVEKDSDKVKWALIRRMAVMRIQNLFVGDIDQHKDKCTEVGDSNSDWWRSICSNSSNVLVLPDESVLPLSYKHHGLVQLKNSLKDPKEEVMFRRLVKGMAVSIQSERKVFPRKGLSAGSFKASPDIDLLCGFEPLHMSMYITTKPYGGRYHILPGYHCKFRITKTGERQYGFIPLKDHNSRARMSSINAFSLTLGRMLVDANEGVEDTEDQHRRVDLKFIRKLDYTGTFEVRMPDGTALRSWWCYPPLLEIGKPKPKNKAKSNPKPKPKAKPQAEEEDVQMSQEREEAKDEAHLLPVSSPTLKLKPKSKPKSTSTSKTSALEAKDAAGPKDKQSAVPGNTLVQVANRCRASEKLKSHLLCLIRGDHLDRPVEVRVALAVDNMRRVLHYVSQHVMVSPLGDGMVGMMRKLPEVLMAAIVFTTQPDWDERLVQMQLAVLEEISPGKSHQKCQEDDPELKQAIDAFVLK